MRLIVGANMSKIEVSNLTVLRGGIPIVQDISLAIGVGEAVRLTGPNGCGKSTLLRAMVGLLSSLCGSVTFQGRHLQPDDFVFLDHKLLMKDRLSVSENLAFWQGILMATDERLDESIAQWGLSTLLHLPFGILSAGQKKRVQLSLLTLSSVLIWILDEPLLSLDLAYVGALSGVAQAHISCGGMFLYASHDPLPGLTEQSINISLRDSNHALSHAA